MEISEKWADQMFISIDLIFENWYAMSMINWLAYISRLKFKLSS